MIQTHEHVSILWKNEREKAKIQFARVRDNCDLTEDCELK